MMAKIITDADIEYWSKFGYKSEEECSKAMWNYGCMD